ncbi:hypothetical protein [Candidatus Berkiella aquae]|uniref:Apolipoprotein A1/A4/E domain protein n=1 Tax=Candidatus Berkiella aquae TaxID=295108 RepID=A0A0Q9YN88_9GAMM|nr:hypothetical protein [Candidatus Berkiella aquae]MCS5710937.1 hypothetical protein [Candidatus Berkiella aquae]
MAKSKKVRFADETSPETLFNDNFNRAVQYANNLSDPEFNRVFNELSHTDKYPDSGEIPKIGDAFAIAYPYLSPGSKADNRNQLVIDTISEYTQLSNKAESVSYAGDVIQLINHLRTWHDKIVDMLSKYDTGPDFDKDILDHFINSYNVSLNLFEIAAKKSNQPDLVNMIKQFEKIRDQTLEKKPIAKIELKDTTTTESEAKAKKSRTSKVKAASIAAKKSLNSKVKKINKKLADNTKKLNKKLADNTRKLNKKLADNTKKLNKQLADNTKKLNEQLTKTSKKVNKKITKTAKKVSRKFTRNKRPIVTQQPLPEVHQFSTNHASAFAPLTFGVTDLEFARKNKEPLVESRGLRLQELGNIITDQIIKHENNLNEKDSVLIKALYNELNKIDAEKFPYDEQGNNKHTRMVHAIVKMYHEAKNTNCDVATNTVKAILTALKIPVPITLNDILNSNIKALYNDKRTQAEPIKLAMYGIAKNAAKIMNQKNNIRQQQINNIQILFNELKAGSTPPAQDKAMIAYAYLSKVINDIKGEKNKFDSGMEKICTELKNNITQQFPDIEKSTQHKSEQYIEAANALIKKATPVEPKRSSKKL